MRHALIWNQFCQVGRGKRRPRPSPGTPLPLTERGFVVASVSHGRRVVKSDIRGLVTAGRTVLLEWIAGLEIERNRLRCR